MIYGQIGWKEFLASRDLILLAYDYSIKLNNNRPTQTAKGFAVEAAIRDWLKSFLPKKYDVCSGYIISREIQQDYILYHHDLIIYDSLNSPTLWVEGNKDKSDLGSFRAIPAEHVLSVYEIKSTLNRKSIIDVQNKLMQLNIFKEELHEKFSSGAIFIEILEKNNKASLLKSFDRLDQIPKFSHALVLRYELDECLTGLLKYSEHDNGQNSTFPDKFPLAKPLSDIQVFEHEDGSVRTAERGAGIEIVPLRENTYCISIFYGCNRRENQIAVDLSWSRNNFSKFAFDLLFKLDGLTDPKPYLKGTYAKVIDAPKFKPAIEQALHITGAPFLSITLTKSETNLDSLTLNNVGDSHAVGSFDNFKTTGFELDLNTPITLHFQEPQNDSLRLLYKSKNNEGDIYSISISFLP